MSRTPRLLVPIAPAGPALRLEGDQAERIRSVLRMKPGDDVLLFAGDGREWTATIDGVKRGAVDLAIDGLLREEPAAVPELAVWCGLVRPNRFEWLIEKATEAGAGSIVPLVSEHAARGDAVSASRLERWARIAAEAAEQSGRLWVPTVAEAAPFDTLLAEASATRLVVADPTGPSAAEVASVLRGAAQVAVAIGPEGGFSPAEQDALAAAGALPVALGPHILRTETAGVVAVALLRALFPSSR